MGGTSLRLSAKVEITVSIHPEAARVCPNAHLKDVIGGGFKPKMVRIAAASEWSDALVPLP